MRFGYLEGKEPYRSCSISALARELGRHKLDLVGVQEVRWNNGDIVKARD